MAQILYLAHQQERQREEALMLEAVAGFGLAVAGFGLALVVGDAGASLTAFVSVAVQRVRRKGERID